MDGSTINSATITVTANSMPVSGTWTYNETMQQAVFSLDAGTYYPKGATVYVSVGTGVTDTYGVSLASAYDFSFIAFDYGIMVNSSVPANGTAGFALWVVKRLRRLPTPPARIKAAIPRIGSHLYDRFGFQDEPRRDYRA